MQAIAFQESIRSSKKLQACAGAAYALLRSIRQACLRLHPMAVLGMSFMIQNQDVQPDAWCIPVGVLMNFDLDSHGDAGQMPPASHGLHC